MRLYMLVDALIAHALQSVRPEMRDYWEAYMGGAWYRSRDRAFALHAPEVVVAGRYIVGT